MPDILDALTGYPALVLLCFLCGIVLPMPEDIPEVWAGIQVASGQMNWLPAIAAACLGVFVRDGLFFGAGRLLGARALTHPWALRLIGDERLDSARDQVQEHGPIAVLIGRFSIGFRTATFFVAGSMGVRPRDFALWNGGALLVSVPILIGAGYLFGEPVLAGVRWVAEQATWVLPAVVGVGFASLAWSRYSSRQPREA